MGSFLAFHALQNHWARLLGDVWDRCLFRCASSYQFILDIECQIETFESNIPPAMRPTSTSGNNMYSLVQVHFEISYSLPVNTERLLESCSSGTATPLTHIASGMSICNMSCLPCWCLILLIAAIVTQDFFYQPTTCNGAHRSIPSVCCADMYILLVYTSLPPQDLKSDTHRTQQTTSSSLLHKTELLQFLCSPLGELNFQIV